MKSILVIGLGRFGKHLINKFYELGDEVLAVDIKEEEVNTVTPFVTQAIIGDCTREETLQSLGIKNFDICFVCIGQNFQNSLEITSLLKEMGAKRVVSKAGTEIHAKFLLKNGADEVAYPERDNAHKLASRYSVDNVFDFIELTKDSAIYEIPVSPAWVKKSIIELDIRKKYHINIIAIKQNDIVQPLPNAEYIFTGNEHIIIIGHNTEVEKLMKKINQQIQ
ncbi:MAG: potassium channel family protein [Oscillospiraceae bacterium]